MLANARSKLIHDGLNGDRKFGRRSGADCGRDDCPIVGPHNVNDKLDARAIESSDVAFQNRVDGPANREFARAGRRYRGGFGHVRTAHHFIDLPPVHDLNEPRLTKPLGRQIPNSRAE
jgi:hypothetical protein